MTLVVWEDALAVLAALVAPTDAALRDGMLHLGSSRREQFGLTLPPDVTHDALLALNDVGYVEWRDHQYLASGGVTIVGLRVTGRGMQALGQWPTFNTITTPTSLAHLLETLADYVADEEKAGVLRKVAAQARRLGIGALRQSVVSLSAALVRAKLGLPS